MRNSSKHLTSATKSPGFSLIGALVAISILGILSLAFMTLMNNQNKAVKSLSEKMLSKSLETQMKNVFLNPNYCECFFRGHTLNASVSPAVWNTFPNSIPNAYNQPIPPSPTLCTQASGNIVPSAGTKVSGSNVRVASLGMQNIFYQGSGSYTGSISVTFDPASMERAIKNIELPVSFTVDTSDPANSRKFTSCGISQQGPVLVGSFSNIPSYNITLPPGNYDLILISNYFLCEDRPVNMILDGAIIETYIGANNDSSGCDQNSIMKTETVSGGLHTVSFSGATDQVTAAGEQWQHVWIAVKK